MTLFPRVRSLLLAFAAAWNLSAEELEYSSHMWQLQDGLPYPSVQAITQTPDGYLWVGTWKGLARFDGLTFTAAEEIAGSELKDIAVSALSVSRNGTLWVGTATQGIFCLSSNSLTRISIPSLIELPNNQVLGLFEDEDSTMWIATRDGLLQYRNQVLTWVKAVPKTTVRSIGRGENGEFWLASSAGLIRFKDKILQRFTHTNELPSSLVRAVCLDRDGNLWSGSNQGLSRLQKNKFAHFSKNEGLSDLTVSSIHQDRHGTIWIGTFGGLNRFVNGRLVVELAHSGFPFDVVFCFYEDVEGNLWVGAKDGLHRLSRKRFKTITTQQGLSHNNIMSVMEDRNHTVWVGTWGGGLQRIETNQITSFTPNKTNKLSSELILGLHETADGRLWIGTDYDAGLIEFKNGQFHRFAASDRGFTPHAVRAISSDQNTNLWVGTSAGLFQITGTKYKLFKKNHGLPEIIVRCLLNSRDNTLWVGTSHGLATKTTNGFSVFEPKNPWLASGVSALHEDPDGTLWIGTLGAGLIRSRNGTLTQFSTAHGLFSDEIFEILDDELGSFWMTSLKGIFRISKEDLAKAHGKNKSVPCVSYAAHDGLMSVQCNGVAKPGACRTHDGKLWFATTKGIAVIDPKTHSRKNEKPPPVAIEKVVADKMKVARDEWPVAGSNNPVTRHLSPVTVPPGRGELEFHFTALSLQAAEKNQFRYKLEGIDPDWSDADTRRVAHYSKIPPGTYIFRVKGSNNDGVWNETGASLTIVMLPHFWQTWWFRSSLGAIACAMLGLVYHVRVSRLRALEQLRLRIAADLHDDVGASLTKIAMLSEMAERETPDSIASKAQLREIAQTNRGVIQAMEEIVWTIKPKNDTVDNLVNFLVRYSQKYFRNTAIRCRLDVPAELSNQPISPNARHNLFLAFKEALNNVAKHSGSSEVSIEVIISHDRLSLVVTDRGVGFENKSTGRGGNGLPNMERRLQEIGGRFKIETASGKGTKVTLEIPLS